MRGPELLLAADRLVVEDAVGAEVFALRSVRWCPQIDRGIRERRLLRLLVVESDSSEIAVQQTGAIALAASVSAVDPPTQYSRRLGWSAAHRTARAAISGW